MASPTDFNMLVTWQTSGRCNDGDKRRFPHQPIISLVQEAGEKKHLFRHFLLLD